MTSTCKVLCTVERETEEHTRHTTLELTQREVHARPRLERVGEAVLGV